ncbi:uncharacterized protein IL334_002676 [Kwoniella shivajii]|uniref:RNA-dependent RNA polymerase n=1 Tax=Kwoniella shivajii TaxID=564305 RepID=A0ABZ1CW13_9TREE|nr:hypothetical protein IL334_002676 [Kwoniella shivajii]
METVGSGFHPGTSAYPASKLHHLVDVLSRKLIREFKIPVEQSLTAFMIPDTLQILKPDEIFICFSGNGPIDEITKIPMAYLEGEVLAYRSPCKVPTDVRRFKAVYRPELTHLKDCIVLSAKSELCKRSPASYMSGGDYDGDTLQLFWDKDIVEHFRNPEDMYAETPDDFEKENFDKEIMKGTEFLNKIECLDEESSTREMQGWLLGAMMGDELTGKYSDLHGNAVYTLGYSHPETIRLARMFCHVLDARKSGLRVKKEKRKGDVEKYGGELEWRLWKKDDDSSGRGSNPIMLKRGKGLGPFVMDVLMEEGIKCRNEIMQFFPSGLVEDDPRVKDSKFLDDWKDLRQLWRNLTERSQDVTLQEDLKKIKNHVKACYTIRQNIMSDRCDDITTAYNVLVGGKTIVPSPRKSRIGSSIINGKKAESSERSLEMLTNIRQLAHIWQTKPTLHEIPNLEIWGDDLIKKVKISCLSEMPSDKKKQFCGFDFDFSTICEMKAKTTGKDPKTILQPIYMDMKPR